MENLEYIFPQDLKMWAKSAGRKFLEAQEKTNEFLNIDQKEQFNVLEPKGGNFENI